MKRWLRAVAAAVLSLAFGGPAVDGPLGRVSPAAAQEPPPCMTAGEAEAGSLALVLVADDGRPARRFRATLGRASGPRCEATWMPTGPSEKLRIERLTAGTYRLRVEAPGHGSADTAVVVKGGATAEVRLVLPRRPTALPEIVSWIRGDGEAAEIPGRSLEHLDLSDRPLAAPSLADWLASLPGVVVRPTASGRQVVSVRGSRPEGVLVLLDGVPLNDPVTGVADLASVPLATLESATLVRGAVAGQGPGALAGLLVLRSRSARGAGVSAGVEAGSFRRLGAEGFGSVRGALGSVSAAVRYDEAENDFSFVNRVVPGDPRERRRNADVRRRHGTLTAVAASIPLVLRVRADAVERGVPGRMGTAIFDQARWEERGSQLSAELGPAGGPMLQGGVRTQTFEFRDGRSDRKDRQRAEDLRLRTSLPLPAGVRASARLTRAEVSGDGLADGAARLTGGLGLDGRLELAGVTAHPSLELDVATGVAAWSPALALEAHPGRHWSLRGRAGRAFRLPSFGDLYFSSAHRVQPNPDLRPERVGLDAEIEARWRSGEEGVEVGVTAFHRHTEDPIVWLASAVAVWSPRNLDRLSGQGVEVAAGWRGGDGWRVQASGTWDRSRVGFGTNRNPAPYLPELRGRASVEWAGRGRAARLELEGTGSRTTSLAATHRLDGFALLNLAVRQSVDIAHLPLVLDARVRNLLDAGYELVSLFPQPGRGLELRIGVGPIPSPDGKGGEP